MITPSDVGSGRNNAYPPSRRFTLRQGGRTLSVFAGRSGMGRHVVAGRLDFDRDAVRWLRRRGGP